MFYFVLFALLAVSFGFSNPIILRLLWAHARKRVADTLANAPDGVWRWYPRRLRTWLFLNADLY